MSLTLYNTLTRQKEAFVPLDPQNVRLYVCGPTVYDYAHLGNARPYVVVDVLTRLLKFLYPKVTTVRNITDIDDKIINAARERGQPIQQLTQETTRYFEEDMKALGNLPPTIEPRATEHVSEMIEMIEALIKKGFAYEVEGHVLYSVKSFPEYGQLSRCCIEDMVAGSRVEVAPYKKDPRDFVLWKPSPEDCPGWESPWGVGRPGWHIECSAMASKYLNTTFDIHAGGQDLIFPHHENELAQSQAVFGPNTFARVWLHNGMVTVDGEKMSKSLGNFKTIRGALEEAPGEVVRYLLLSSHYHQPLDWTDRSLEQARQSLNRLYTALRGHEVSPEEGIYEPIKAALEDDLNTPLALSYLHEIASTLNKAESIDDKKLWASRLKSSAGFLGLLLQDVESWFKGETAIEESTIVSLIENRNKARKEKNFALADKIRQDLLKQGIILEDSSQGTIWRK